MVKIPLAALLLLLSISSFSQYWQQQVNYSIDVSLNDKEHTLDGFVKMEYSNHSPDTLSFIWFHLWPNAYKSDRTAFSNQLLENGNTKFYFSSKEQKGYINRLDFKVNNTTARLEDHPQHIDIVKLLLPEPLAPGKTIIISTPFHVKLPYNFSRGGYDGQSYQCTQWYPKPAVYDKKGWHPLPYLDQGEFYSEFGSYDVRITVPENYVVAATGELQDEKEKEWLKTRNNFSWTPVQEKIKIKGGGTKTITQKFPLSATTLKTLQFKQDKVHDFAWFADKRFIVNTGSAELPSGKAISVFTYYTAEQKEVWNESVAFAKRALLHYSKLVGEYPYATASVVQGPKSFGGGMEYPTITVISPVKQKASLDKVIAHELGHNWFYGILASHERSHPWMDEGMNSFYEEKYTVAHYKRSGDGASDMLKLMYAERKDQPIETQSEAFTYLNYGLFAYTKASAWMQLLEQQIDSTRFAGAMQDYFRQWKFKHPYPEDFKALLEKNAGRSLDSSFALLGKTGPLPAATASKGPVVFFFPGSKLNQLSARNTLLVSPFGFGINSYDGFMAGGIITNSFPSAPYRSGLQFLLVPQYGLGSGSFNGLGRISYRFFPQQGAFSKITAFAGVSAYSMNMYKDDEGHKTYLRFTKLAPGLRLTLREPSARSTRQRYLQWKTFLIHEDQPRFYRDTVISGTDTAVLNRIRTEKENYTINQLTFTTQNFRALYPWKAEVKIEQGKEFLRTAFTANYFFNYAKGGGLDVRFFAGKFFYTSGKTISKQFATDRYHLNMTGANGYEDYTYSDYFIGRNKFEKLPSQQIMIRDGGFKVRTDLLADKVGKTDNWLAAVNFSTTIPSSLNPLNLLPVKIPVKLFADIGTYSDAWERDSDLDRFIFDAGLHLPLFKETVNIYIPFVYSRVYKSYIQSTLEQKGRLWKTVSFSIDISNFTFKRFDRNIPF